MNFLDCCLVVSLRRAVLGMSWVLYICCLISRIWVFSCEKCVSECFEFFFEFVWGGTDAFVS